MDNETKEAFEKSKIPQIFCCSIDPVTGEHNWEYIEGDNADWMKELVKKDFPERFYFSRLNQAAVDSRNERLFGIKPGEKL